MAGLGAGLFVLLSGITGGDTSRSGRWRSLVFVGVLVVVGIAAVVSWAVTRWRVHGSDLQIETGLIRRQSLRIPLSRIQAVDIVMPLTARILGLAEVRVVSAGRGAERGRLAYLGAADAAAVRAQLLALAHGLAAETPEPPVFGLFKVDNGRLVASMLLRGPTLLLAVVLLGPAIAVAAAAGPSTVAVAGILPSAAILVIDLLRSVNADYDFAIGESPDGLRLHRGLLQRRNETIPYGRIQAVRFVEPLLWRPFGWCRLDVDVARQHDPQREKAEIRQLARALAPVATRAEAAWVLSRIMPGAMLLPPPGSGPPPRAVWRAPLSFHYLRVWHDPWYLLARTGRVRPATVVLPLEKIQSVRMATGPLTRALRLATVHVDTAGHRWQASAPCRDDLEAHQLLHGLSGLARQARRSRLAVEASAQAPQTP